MANYEILWKYQNEAAVHLLRWNVAFTETVWAALCADLAPRLSGTAPTAPDPITAALLLRKQTPEALAQLAAKFNINEKQVWALLIDRADPTITCLARFSDVSDQIRRLIAEENSAEQLRLHANYNYGVQERQRQTDRAKKSRIKTGAGSDQPTPAAIIAKLACAEQYNECSAKELWPLFFSELESNHFDPLEDDLKPGKLRYTYDLLDKRKTITFGHFANEVAAYRKKKSD